MDFILNIFAIPVSYILKGLSFIFGHNFAVLMLMLTIIVNLAMLPLTVKSQRSAAKQQMLRPKLDLLKKKYGEDMTPNEKRDYQMEMQELYQKENVSMSGGCLPLLIRMPFLFAVYRVIQSPLTYIFNQSKEQISALLTAVNKVVENKIPESGYNQIQLFNVLRDKLDIAGAKLAEQFEIWNFGFFGLDLTATPKFSFNFAEVTGDQLKLWIIPFLAFGAQMLTSIISLRIQKKANPDQPSMTGMMLTMPLISLFFAFSLPAAVGLYWAFSSLVGGLIQAGIQIVYSPSKLIADEQAKLVVKRYNEEKSRVK